MRGLIAYTHGDIRTSVRASIRHSRTGYERSDDWCLEFKPSGCRWRNTQAIKLELKTPDHGFSEFNLQVAAGETRKVNRLLQNSQELADFCEPMGFYSTILGYRSEQSGLLQKALQVVTWVTRKLKKLKQLLG
jgi:hypothetical protein